MIPFRKPLRLSSPNPSLRSKAELTIVEGIHPGHLLPFTFATHMRRASATGMIIEAHALSYEYFGSRYDVQVRPLTGILW